MAGIEISKSTAERIVNAGSRHTYSTYQFLPQNPRTLRLQETQYATFLNDGRWTLEPGEYVGVVGMMDANLTSEEAHDKFVSDGLRLRTKRIGLIDDSNAAWLGHGVALDSIAPGATGRGVTWDLFLAYVWRDPAVIGEERRFLERAEWLTTDWTDPQGVSRRIRRLSFVKYPGDYTCIDAAAPIDDQVLCLLNPSPDGPAVDSISSVDTSAGTAVMACGVTATSPLVTLSQDHVNKKCLLFRNQVSRGWQIILPPDN